MYAYTYILICAYNCKPVSECICIYTHLHLHLDMYICIDVPCAYIYMNIRAYITYVKRRADGKHAGILGAPHGVTTNGTPQGGAHLLLHGVYHCVDNPGKLHYC